MDDIKFEFEYYDLTPCELGSHGINSLVPRRCVDATIEANFGTDRGHALLGTSVCSPKDNFRKSKGRKLAVANAIQELPKEDRKKIWEAYFDMCKE